MYDFFGRQSFLTDFSSTFFFVLSLLCSLILTVAMREILSKKLLAFRANATIAYTLLVAEPYQRF